MKIEINRRRVSIAARCSEVYRAGRRTDRCGGQCQVPVRAAVSIGYRSMMSMSTGGPADHPGPGASPHRDAIADK